MFATTLGIDNFDCTTMNAHLKKFTVCLREGLIPGPEPAILECYGLYCVCLNVSKACSPRKNFLIRHSDIASEAMFGQKMLLESPHL